MKFVQKLCKLFLKKDKYYLYFISIFVLFSGFTKTHDRLTWISFDQQHSTISNGYIHYLQQHSTTINGYMHCLYQHSTTSNGYIHYLHYLIDTNVPNHHDQYFFSKIWYFVDQLWSFYIMLLFTYWPIIFFCLLY